MGGFAFDFPTDGGNVSGQGIFYAWGNFSAPIVGVTSGSVTWMQGGVQQNGQVQMLLSGNGVWSALVTGNIPAGTSVTLTMTAMSQPPPQPSQPQPSPVPVQEVRNFTFNGPSPQTLMLAKPAAGTGT